MDWSNVTVEELVDALKEVEWSTPPRPLAEFVAKFTVPKTHSKWDGRVKCNFYYYRTNYFILLALIQVIAFVRNPLALVAVLFTILSVACLNDSFAVSLSEKLTRAVRRISPPLAHKLRAPISTGPRGRPMKGTVYICGRDRRYFVAVLSTVSVLLWWYSSAIVTVLGVLIVGLSLPLLHASFRTPNLKARLNSFGRSFVLSGGVIVMHKFLIIYSLHGLHYHILGKSLAYVNNVVNNYSMRGAKPPQRFISGSYCMLKRVQSLNKLFGVLAISGQEHGVDDLMSQYCLSMMFLPYP